VHRLMALGGNELFQYSPFGWIDQRLVRLVPKLKKKGTETILELKKRC
jgi:hypothetical protein